MTLAPRPAFISRQIREGRYLFLHLPPPAGIPLAVVCAGIETCADDYRIERSAFPYHALEYVASGTGRFRAQGIDHELRAGSVLAYGPETPHEIRTHGAPLTKFFVDLAGEAVPSRLAAAGLPPGRHRQLGSRRWVHDLFDQLIDCARLPRETALELAPPLVEAILVRLSIQADATDLATGSRQSFQRCRDYLRTHFRTLQTVEEASQACGVSLPYLSRLFKAHTAESPYQYLVRLKMVEAADLLLRGQLEVKSVGARVGFTDPYHFSRAFKKFHGASPRAFRASFHRG